MPLDHERLVVYQRAIDFVAWADEFMESAKLKGELRSQLERASISTPLNIAEGNGKFSIRDRIRFLDIAYGSALESAACLDVARARRMAVSERIDPGKRIVEEVVRRLVRLREALEARLAGKDSSSRVGEPGIDDGFSLFELEASY
ncbi:MAG: four helix bundle protein [Verrucomicrobiae bacterium]|nr:four helix bundle protein [Verrucomicrobiae bacterium]